MKTLFTLLLLFAQSLQAADTKTYDIEIKARITITPVEDAPEPPPPPPPDTKPLPLLIEVGPGKLFEELSDVDPTLVPENATIKVYYREAPYRAKFALVKPGLTLEGVPGPYGQRPVISGENAKTHSKSPLSLGIQTISVLCVSKIDEADKVTIRGLVVRDAWEQDSYTNSVGAIANYSAGAGLIRVTAGTVLVENCILTEGIHGLFGKCTEGHGATVTLKDCEVVGCGNATAHNDESVYTELKKFIVDHSKIHGHRNPSATGLHSRDANLSVLNGSYIESEGITILSNSCEVVPLQDPPGKIIGGLLEIRDSVIFNTGAPRAVELKTETSPAMTKGRLIIHDSLFVKQMFKHEWKSFWITLRDSSQSAEIHNSTFISCSQPNAPPTPCYFSTGVNESLIFTGKNTYIGQSPLANKVYMLWGGTARLNENWESTFTVTTGQDQAVVAAKVLELIKEKTE